MFDAKSIVSMGDTALQLACIQAYNDFLVDFSDEQPGRYIPVTGLPFWDLDATLAEIERCAAHGHKGIVFTQDPSYFGLPQLTDRYWDPMWASAQEKGLPVNFHIASGDLDLFNVGHPDNGIHANYAAMGVSFFLANARTIAQLITGGICHRFPELNFVSVESGIGWIPFALEALDWQWQNCGVHKEHPEYDLLPSEYFKRQIYGCFWFERDSALHALEQIGADNILYETDYPHPTSMSPGPASHAQRPDDYLRDVFAGVDDDVAAQDPPRQRGAHLPPRLSTASQAGAAPGQRRALDLDVGAECQATDGDRRSSGIAVGGEVRGVDGVHLGERADVGEEHADLDDVVHRAADLFEHGLDVLEHLGGLGPDATWCERARSGQQADLTGQLPDVADSDGVGEGEAERAREPLDRWLVVHGRASLWRVRATVIRPLDQLQCSFQSALPGRLFAGSRTATSVNVGSLVIGLMAGVASWASTAESSALVATAKPRPPKPSASLT